MNSAVQHPELFGHVRIIMATVLGLSVARLLNGLARFVQHPTRDHVYGVHIGWVFFLLLSVVHFWWFEFGLSRIETWTFQVYFFVLTYAALFFFICAVLFPDKMDDYKGYADYFESRQRWFYGLLSVLFVLDVFDTLLKGIDHFKSLGSAYPYKQSAFFMTAVIAMFVKKRRFHALFVATALFVQIWFILAEFEILG